MLSRQETLLSYEYLKSRQKDAFNAWLKSASADDRHACAVSWNWDGDNTPLEWIIKQPDCEKATALWIFWHAEPTYYMGKFASHAAAQAGSRYDLAAYDFIKAILDRWKAHVYRNDEIMFDPASANASISDVERYTGHAELSIPVAMVHAVGRREAQSSHRFDEGIPFFILNGQ